MGDSSDVPELKKDLASRGMNALDNFFPSCDLFGGVDPGSVGIAVAERGDGGSFANDQSSGSALAVIFGVEIIGNVTWRGSASGEWGHQDPMGKAKGSQLEGSEKARHLGNSKSTIKI